MTKKEFDKKAFEISSKVGALMDEEFKQFEIPQWFDLSVNVAIHILAGAFTHVREDRTKDAMEAVLMNLKIRMKEYRSLRREKKSGS